MIGRLSFAAMAAFLLVAGASAAQAQASRTWVSGVGDDANPCARTAPCKTFAGAISKTAAGGEIDTVDNGAFGAVTITKAISIIGMGPGQSGVLAPAVNGITVSAGPNDVVRLEGLTIEGMTTGINGVRFLAGAALHVKNSLIYGFKAGSGISFAPASGTAELYITDTTIAENGSATGGGVDVAPTAAANAIATLDNVRLLNNTSFGIRADGNGTSGGVALSIQRSTIAGQNTGSGVIARDNASGGAIAMVGDSNFAGNLNAISAVGAGIAWVTISKSVLTSNSNLTANASGGVTYSTGDNAVLGNGTETGLTSLPPK